MSNSSDLKTVVLYGSARRDRQGIKAARFVVRQLEARGHDVTLIDSQEYELPMLDWMYKEYEPGQAPEAMQEVADLLSAADGFVVVSSEYNHSIPAAFPVSNIRTAFDDEGHSLEKSYDRRSVAFLDEFEWYANALRRARIAAPGS